MLELWKLPILITTGIIAGIINVIAGGGSMLTLPVMVMMGLPSPVANGTNRIGILLQNISAVSAFFRKGVSSLQLSLSLSLCALPGALLGAIIGSQIDGKIFERILGIVMLILIVVIGKEKAESSVNTRSSIPSRKRYIWAHIFIVCSGFYGGFMQAGVGFFVIIILHKFLGLNMLHTNLHKVFIAMVYTVFAILIFGMRGLIWWVPGLVLSVGTMTGAWIGSRIAIKKSDKVIGIFLRVMMFIFAIRLLFF